MTGAGDMDEPRVGDLAIVPYPRVREQIGCDAEAGLLMEDRRSVVRVFFPGSGTTYWLDRDKIQVVPLGRIPVHPLVERLHRIARRIDALLIEFTDQEGDVGLFHVYAPSLVLDDLTYVRDLIGGDLNSMRVEAGSVRRVKLRLAFRV